MRGSVVLLFLASLAVSSCAGSPPVRRDVVIGLLGEPESIFADDAAAKFLRGAVTETLVRMNARDEFVPRLAADVPTFENGGLHLVTDDPSAPGGRLVATFRLRDGARWQDGDPITASDVLFAFEQDRAAPPGSEARWLADRVERVEVIDARFVRFVYRANERWENYPLAARVLPRHILADANAAARLAYQREPVHAGPFGVAAWLPGYGVTLTAFEGYVGGAPALGRVEVRFLSDRGAILNALRRGDIDVAPSPALEPDIVRTLDRLAEANSLQVYYTPAESLEMLRFGDASPRFADRRVRKAIELTVDRGAIVDDIFAGRARVPRSYLVPPLWAAVENAPSEKPDHQEARALLQAAGFVKGAFGILERPGERMIVTLLVADGSAARLDAGGLVAGDLAAIGIAAEVRVRPLAEVNATVARGDFDLALVPEDASDAQVASDRYVGLVDPWFDALAAAARSTGDRSEKRGLYAEMQLIWSDTLPGLPLYQDLLVDVAPLTLQGVLPAPQGDPLTWNAQEWRFVTP